MTFKGFRYEIWSFWIRNFRNTKFSPLQVYTKNTNFILTSKITHFILTPKITKSRPYTKNRKTVKIVVKTIKIVVKSLKIVVKTLKIIVKSKHNCYPSGGGACRKIPSSDCSRPKSPSMNFYLSLTNFYTFLMNFYGFWSRNLKF